MSQHTISTAVSIALALIGLAIVALLVSQQAQTPGVLKASGSSLAQALSCALSPVTGGGCGTSVTSTIHFGGLP